MICSKLFFLGIIFITTSQTIMINFRKFIPYLLVFFTLFSLVRGEEEDDLLGEIAVDLLVGAGMALCETSASCSAIMTIFSGIVLMFMLCTCICGSDRDRRDMWDNMPSTRRIGTTGAGYYMGRGAFR